MSANYPFNPKYGSGQTFNSTGTSASTTIGKGNKQLMIANVGSNVAYVRVGASSVSATNSDCPVLPGTFIVLTKFEDNDVLDHISATGTTLSVNPGS